jgi:hypothetical protein
LSRSFKETQMDMVILCAVSSRRVSRRSWKTVVLERPHHLAVLTRDRESRPGLGDRLWCSRVIILTRINPQMDFVK